MLVVRRWPDARAFRARAERWLLEAEAEHNLLLGILDRLDQDPDAYDHPVYLATAELDGQVVGCAFRTPPYKLGFTRMPLEAVDAVVRDVVRVYAHIPIAIGPEPVALRFGERYAELRGVRTRVGMRQRLYRADAVIPPARPAPGRGRVATMADLAVVEPWYAAFHRDVGSPANRPGSAAARLHEGVLWLWEDEGRPTSMAGWAARTERWARVAYVYTPPELRGRGYATALVAELTGALLDGGRCALLYTDLGNPVSNSIYRAIGYRPLEDVVDVEVVRATT